MSLRVLICGEGGSDELAALFGARGLAAEVSTRPGVPEELRDCLALVLAPKANEAGAVTAQVAVLAPRAEAQGCLLGVLMPGAWPAAVGYGLLRTGAAEASADPADLCERLLARAERKGGREQRLASLPPERGAVLVSLPTSPAAPSGPTARPRPPAAARSDRSRTLSGIRLSGLRPQRDGGHWRERPLLLVVEDDAAEREALCELLGQTHDVLFARDGEEGARLARERVPDLVLLDLVMPKLDGFAAMEKLRRNPRTAGIPAIVVSAQPDEVVRVRALDLGAADYVAKPFSGRELVTRIERTLRMARERDALLAMAQTDALTGLPNFRAFKARLDDEFRRARRYRFELSCVMVDLDNLKAINDRLGHATGNRAIALVAEALKAELRATDFAARYGGDEFVVLLPHTSEKDASTFAERVRRRFAGTCLEAGGVGIPLRASLGVAASAGQAADDAEALLGRADSALYAAKAAGRARVVLASTLRPADEAPA